MNCGTLVLLSIPFLGLSGCMEAAMQMRGQTVPATLLPRNTSGPEAAPEGSCWAKHITPAVIETITSPKQLSLPVDQAGNFAGDVPCRAILDEAANSVRILGVCQSERDAGLCLELLEIIGLAGGAFRRLLQELVE